MIKLVYVIRKHKDISEKDFHADWLNEHESLVRSFAKAMRAKRYVQSHTVSEDAGKQFRESRKMTETYDGITEVWWDSLEDLGRADAIYTGAILGSSVKLKENRPTTSSGNATSRRIHLNPDRIHLRLTDAPQEIVA